MSATAYRGIQRRLYKPKTALLRGSAIPMEFSGPDLGDVTMTTGLRDWEQCRRLLEGRSGPAHGILVRIFGRRSRRRRSYRTLRAPSRGRPLGTRSAVATGSWSILTSFTACTF